MHAQTPLQLQAVLSVIFHSGTSSISDLPSTVTPTLHALYTRLSAIHHHPEISPAQIQQKFNHDCLPQRLAHLSLLLYPSTILSRRALPVNTSLAANSN